MLSNKHSLTTKSQKNMKLRLLSLLAILAFANTIFAQVFPVSMTGTHIGPRSLDLSVYANQRSNDLFFTATLMDPVEPFRDVRLRLSIENNGQLVYVTDPNFAFPPLRLDRLVTETLDGFALAPYLQPAALTGPAGTGTGSVFVPEGLNRICIEIIDIQRNVPISKKTCVTNSFVLNQPPQLQLPVCGSTLPISMMQNQLFNWTPMHIGSANSPAPVEYKFELKEIMPGLDPNDAFDFSLSIYETSTFSPSLIYTHSEPILEPGKTYGWRITAKSSVWAGWLFQNDGKSAVCSFTCTNNDGSNLLGNNGLVSEQNEEIRVPPLGCEVFNTDFGPVQSSGQAPIPLANGDKVKIGYFEMEVNDATPSPEGYSGTGSILVPMLNTKVNVTFTDLKVKPSTRAYEAGSVIAVMENQFQIDPTSLAPSNLGYVFSADYTGNLEEYFSTGAGLYKKTTGFDIANPAAVDLPLAIDRTDASGNPLPLIAITGMTFTPRNAYIVAVAWIRSTPGAPLMRFASVGFPITPSGVKTNSMLIALDNAGAPGGGTFALTPIFNMQTGSSGPGNGMTCDCLGYKNLGLDAVISVSQTVMAKATDGAMITFGLSDPGNPATYLGGIEDFSDFKLPAMPGFVFTMNEGQIDLSPDAKLNLAAFPGYYEQPGVNDWKGLYLGEVDVKLPAAYDLSGQGKQLILDQGTLFVGEQGAYGKFKKINVFDLNNGTVGNWKYSIDTMELSVLGSQADETSLAGRIQLPVFDDPFSYQGDLDLSASDITLTVQPDPGEKDMGLWHATFDLAPESVVLAKLKDMGPEGRQLFPSADLTGVLNMHFTAAQFDNALAGNKGIIKNRLKGIFEFEGDVPEFHLQNLLLEHFKIDPYLPVGERYKLEDYLADPGGLIVGTHLAELGEVRLVYLPDTGNGTEELALEVVVKKDLDLVQFTFFAKSTGGAAGFVFDRIEVQTEKVQCKCTSYVPFDEIDPASMGLILEKVYDQFYAPDAFGFSPAGSLAGGNALKLQEENNQLLNAYKAGMIANLHDNLVAGFPILDEVLTIPFLGVQLDFQKVGTNYKAVTPDPLKNPNDWTFPAIDNHTAKTGVRQLPLELTDELRTAMGMKKTELPENSRLLITAFEITDGSGTLTEANTKVEFTLLVKIGDQYVRFVRKDVKVSPTSVDMKDFYLMLEQDLELDNRDFNGTNEKPGGLKLIKGKTSSSLPIRDDQSYAYLTCDGFQEFNVQGVYAVPFKGGASPEGKLKYRDLTKATAKDAEQQLKLAFTINQKTELAYFIAPLREKTTDDKPLQFVVEGEEGLIFKAGESVEMYLDFDPNLNRPSMPQAAGSGFRGLYFKKMQVELEGLVMDNNGAPLELEVKDFYFTAGANGGMNGRLMKYGVLPYSAGVKVGGWNYTVDGVLLNFDGTASADGACFVEGGLRCPLFDDYGGNDLIPYSGRLSFRRDTEYHPAGNFQAGKGEDGSLKGMVFQADWIPGMFIALQEGSSIKFDWVSYGNGKKGFRPSSEMNGMASLFLSKKIAGAMSAAAEKAAEWGIEFNLPNISFQGLKMNGDPAEAETVTLDNPGNGIITLNMGTWGASLGPLADALEWKEEVKNLKELRDGVNHWNATHPTSASSTPPASGTPPSGDKPPVVSKPPPANPPPATPPPANPPIENAESKRKMVQDTMGNKSILNGFGFNIDTPEFEYLSVKKEWKLKITISVNLLGSDDDDDNNTGTSASGGSAPPVAKVPPVEKVPPLGTGSTGQGKSKVADLSASTSLGFYFKPDPQKVLAYSGIGLDKISVAGSFGPVEIAAALQFLKGETAAEKAYGEGFKAYGDLRFGKQPNGTYTLAAKAMLQFGTVKKPDGSKYSYFFVDLEAIIATQIAPHFGTPLIKILPPIDVLNLHGVGGGIYINMEKVSPVDYTAPETEQEMLDVKGLLSNKENTSVEQTYEAITDDLMKPGRSLTGFQYIAKKGSYGGYIKGIFSIIQPRMLTFDLAVGIEVGFNNAGNFSFKKIFARGNGYILSPSVPDREQAPVKAFAEIEMDFANQRLSGAFQVQADFALPADIMSLKIDPAKTRGSFLVEFKKGGKFYFKAGRPLARMGADLKLIFIKAQVGMYLQLGQDLDPIPEVSEIVPGWPEPGPANRPGFSPKSGLCFGLNFEVGYDLDVAIFYAKIRGGMGFDLALGHTDAMCNNPPYRVGMDGWLAQGQVYAYLEANVGMQYNLLFLKGKVKILDAFIGAQLKGQIPNPSLFAGQLTGRYNVLNGLLKGKFNLKFEMISKKDKECMNSLYDPNYNPVADILIVGDKYPENDGDTDIPIFANPKLAYNLSVGQEMVLEEIDPDGNTKIRYFRPDMHPTEGILLKKNGVTVPCNYVHESESSTLKPIQMLEPQTGYSLSYRFLWMEKVKGKWVPLKVNETIQEETGTVNFTTGKIPDVMVSEMLSYHAPGNKQRYWHQGYAEPRINFSKPAPAGTSWQKHYFPPSKDVPAYGTVIYDYIVRLTRFHNGVSEEVKDIPLSEYPGVKNFQVAVTEFRQIGSQFVIPTVTTQNEQGLNVGFAGLDDLITTGPEWKGKLYRIEIIRLPLLPSTATSTTETTSTGSEGNELTIKKTSLAKNESRLHPDDGLKVLYEYWFGTSKMNSLHEKLKTIMDISPYQTKSPVNKGLNHPTAIGNDRFQIGVGESDLKYNFISFSGSEPFDQYDLSRIGLNMSVTYNNEDGYAFETAPYNHQPQGYGLGTKTEAMMKCALRGDCGDYLWTAYDGVAQGYRNAFPAFSDQSRIAILSSRYSSSIADLNSRRGQNMALFAGVSGESDFFALNEYLKTAMVRARGNNAWISNWEGSYEKLTLDDTEIRRRYADSFGGSGLRFVDKWSRIVHNQYNILATIGYLMTKSPELGHYFCNYNVKGRDAYDLCVDNIYAIPEVDQGLAHWWYMKGFYSSYSRDYTGNIDLQFPQINKWQDMGQKIANINQVPALKVTVSRGGGFVPAAVTAPTQASNFSFFCNVSANNSQVRSVPVGKPVRAMMLNIGDKTVAYWDGDTRELDLFNAAGKRAIKYNVSDPTQLFKVGDEPLALWQLSGTAWEASCYNLLPCGGGPQPPFYINVSFKNGENKGYYFESRGSFYGEYDEDLKLQRKKALHFTRGAGSTANMLTMRMIGTLGNWDFGGCLIVDNTTRQAVAHIDANRILRRYSYSADGYSTAETTYTDNSPICELNPTREYTLYVAKRGQTHYSAALLLDRNEFWKDKVGQFFEEATFGAKEFGPIAPPTLAGYNNQSIAIPGRLEAEHYGQPSFPLLKGKGMAYYINGEGSRGTGFNPDLNIRKGEFMQEFSKNNFPYWENAYGVNFAQPGEWLAYKINVTQTGKYVMKIRYQSSYENEIRFLVNGQSLLDSLVTLPLAGGTDIVEKRLELFDMVKGEHEFRIWSKKGGFILDYLDFQLATPDIEIKGNNQDVPDNSTGFFLNNNTDFGNQPCDGEPKEFTLINRGNATLMLNGSPLVQLSGPNAGDFQVVSYPDPIVGLGATTSFKILFKPTTVNLGLRTATVTIRSNDQNDSKKVYTFDIRATNNRVEAELKSGDKILSSSELAVGEGDIRHFGQVTAPATFTEKEFALYNYGNTPMSPTYVIEGEAKSEFSVSSFPASIGQGEGKTFTVRFTPSPTSGGQRNAFVKITSADCDENPYWLPVGGTASGQEIEITGNGRVIPSGAGANATTDDGRYFGEVALGNSIQNTFVIRNTGNQPLKLSGYTSSNSNDFSITNISFPASIEPGGSLDAIIRHKNPNAACNRCMADITINSNDADEGAYKFRVEARGVSISTGHSLHFDGVNDYVNCGDDAALQITGNAITLEAWIKADEWKPVSNGGSIINKEGNSAGEGYMLRCGDGGKISFTVGTTQPSNAWLTVVTDGGLNTGTWYHVAGVYNGATMKIYVNGVEKVSANKSGSIGNSNALLWLGNSQAQSTRLFKGKIDEVRIWNRALSPLEIETRMNSLLSGTESGLVAYYPFEQGDGEGKNPDVTSLVAGKGPNGVLNNFALSGTQSNWSSEKPASLTVANIAIPAQSLDFDGVDDYVNCGNNAALQITGNAITLEAWIKADTWKPSVGESGIIDKRGDFSGYMLTCGAGKINFTLGLKEDFRGITTTATLSTGAWHHVAGVYNGRTMKIFINGTEQANVTTNYMRSIGNSQTNLLIGTINVGNPADYIFDGKIDEVRIWNRALPSEEITARMNCELNGSEPGLAAYYNFNQGMGGQNNSTETTLRAGKGPNGTLNGFALSGSNSNWSASSAIPVGSYCPNIPLSPEIFVQGGDPLAAIPDGSTNPSISNHTDFGNQSIYDIGSRRFSIKNTGGAPLNISRIRVSGAASGDFTVSPPLRSMVPPGDTTSFSISFKPGTIGYRTADVAITSNAGGAAAEYSFVVGGTGMEAATALDFDGVDDYVQWELPSWAGNTFTFETWINADSWSENFNPIAYVYDRNPPSVGFWLYGTIEGKVKFDVHVESQPYRETLLSSQALNLGTWHHVAVVYNGSAMKIYINGVEDGTKNIGTWDKPRYFVLHLGKEYSYYTSRYFDGKLDEVRIWNRALSAEEIIARKDCQLAGNEPGLVSYFPFNQGVPGASNTSVTKLANQVAGLPDGELKRFSLTGNASNWIAAGSGTGKPPAGNTCPPLPNQPRIALKGSSLGTFISDGASPSETTGSDMGVTNANTEKTATFTIANLGTALLNLSGSPKVTLSGDASFSIKTQPALTSLAAAAGATNFTVAFKPLSAGRKTALATITSNDPGVPSYSFQLGGVGLAPEVEVSGNGQDIADGSTWRLTTMANFTQFGEVLVAPYSSATRIFTVTNTGNASLDLQAVARTSGSTYFTVLPLSRTRLEKDETATFRVVFKPLSPGEWTAVISFKNNDPDESTFDFTVNGDAKLEGTALDFDGVDDYVDVQLGGPDQEITGNAITLEAWINADPWKNEIWRGSIINKEGENQQGYMLSCGEGGKIRFLFGDGANWHELKTTGNLDAGTWYHVAGVYNGSTMKIYVNGVEKASKNQSGNISNTSRSLRIGGCELYPDRVFDGKIDEVRIWNRELSAAEINDRKYCELTGGENGLVAYFKFNQGYAAGSNLGNTLAVSSRNVRIAGSSQSGGLKNFELDGPSSNWVIGNSPVTQGVACGASGGQQGEALDFDGVDDNVNIQEVDLENKSFAIEFWAKRNMAGTSHFIIGQGPNIQNQGLHIGFWDNNRFEFGFYGNDLKTTATFTDNGWHHWACVYDKNVTAGHNRFLYRDGTLVTSDWSGQSFSGSGLLTLGTWSGMHFDGSLDELRIWNRALSAEEITARMNCELDGGEPGLAAYYNFNHGQSGGSNTSEKTLAHIAGAGVGADGTLNGFNLNGNVSNWVAPGGVKKGSKCPVNAGLPIIVLSNSVNQKSIPENDIPKEFNGTYFGTLGVNLSKDFVFNVTNIGTGSLPLGSNAVSISGPNAAEFTVIAQPASGNIPANGARSFTIRFKPAAPGLRNAAVTVASGDLKKPSYTINLQGVGLVLDGLLVTGNNELVELNGIAATANGTDFGSVYTGQSVSTVFTIENRSNTVLNLTSQGTQKVFLSGPDAAHFQVAGQPPATVPPNGKVTFKVTYLPTAEGNHKNVVVSIPNSDPVKAPYTFNIKGIGLRAIISLSSGPDVIADQAAPSTATTFGTDFGICIRKTSRTLTVGNSGSGELKISDIKITGPDAALFSADVSSFTVAPINGSRSFKLFFDPVSLTDIQQKTAVVSIVTNCEGATQLYEFRVAGELSNPIIKVIGKYHSNVANDLNIEPFSANGTDFGDVILGSFGKQSFTVRNTGNANLIIRNAPVLTGQGFTYSESENGEPVSPGSSGSGNYATLMPGKFFTIWVKYTPSDMGSQTATLSISHGSTGNYQFKLKANGIAAPRIAITGNSANVANNPTAVHLTNNQTDLGENPLNESASFTYEVANAGQTDLNIVKLEVIGEGASAFNVTPANLVVPGGQKQTFTISFRPIEVVTYEAGIRITSNASEPDNLYEFPIKGTGFDKVKVEKELEEAERKELLEFLEECIYRLGVTENEFIPECYEEIELRKLDELKLEEIREELTRIAAMKASLEVDKIKNQKLINDLNVEEKDAKKQFLELEYKVLGREAKEREIIMWYEMIEYYKTWIKETKEKLGL